VLSRTRAKKERSGVDVRADLEAQGISVRPGSVRLLSEEAPYAYKDVDEVVRVCDVAELAKPVARLRPLGVVKG
jgi:tRNA-splicing ligase RtcB